MYQEKIQEDLKALATKSSTIARDTTLETLQHWSHTFTQLYNDLREGIQEKTKGEMIQVIKQLENNADITSQELDLIRIWIVGDAHSYIKMENNYEEWIQEAQRLVEAVKSSSTKELTPQVMGELKSMARDATRTLGDITFYKENMERTKKFENSVKKLTADNKIFLAGMLKAKLQSEHV